MNDVINISKNLWREVRAGDVSANELVLCRSNSNRTRTWEIRKASDQFSQHESVFKGSQLSELFQKAANDQPLPEQFAKLGKLQKFRSFAKLIPGMETDEHRQAVQAKIRKIGASLKKPLLTLAVGAQALKEQGKPHKRVGVDYALKEILQDDSSHSAFGVETVSRMWKDSDTPLRFSEWLQVKKQEWEESGSPQEFLPWLAEKNWADREKKAWEVDHPKIPFSFDAFKKWKETQYLPNRLLPEPIWLLKKYWKEETQGKKIPFEKWTETVIENRKNFWRDFPPRTGGIFAERTIDDNSFRELDQFAFEYDTQAGSDFEFSVYIAKREWEQTNPHDRSDAAFRDFVEKRQYNFFVHETSLPFPPSFDEWRQGREEDQQRGWEIAKTSLTFEEWKKQQKKDFLVPAPFIRLDDDQRKEYLADCEGGCLVRKGAPYPTHYEETAHSGRGWVIFVIAPNDSLYCGSHIAGIFHHSSFLADGAVMAAGEIKTDSKGTITHISGKSGHYRPSREENCAMLRWFQARGVDLTQVQFTYFEKDGKESNPVIASEYLSS